MPCPSHSPWHDHSNYVMSSHKRTITVTLWYVEMSFNAQALKSSRILNWSLWLNYMKGTVCLGSLNSGMTGLNFVLLPSSYILTHKRSCHKLKNHLRSPVLYMKIILQILLS
jgi:hypothetical protein